MNKVAKAIEHKVIKNKDFVDVNSSLGLKFNCTSTASEILMVKPDILIRHSKEMNAKGILNYVYGDVREDLFILRELISDNKPYAAIQMIGDMIDDMYNYEVSDDVAT